MARFLSRGNESVDLALFRDAFTEHGFMALMSHGENMCQAIERAPKYWKSEAAVNREKYSERF